MGKLFFSFVFILSNYDLFDILEGKVILFEGYDLENYKCDLVIKYVDYVFGKFIVKVKM